MQAKPLVAARWKPDPIALANIDVALKDMAA